jgi:hypothetical protein
VLPDEALEVGDFVFAGLHSQVHWEIKTIESRTDPLGVVLESGMTGRTRRDSLANLRLFKKGNA